MSSSGRGLSWGLGVKVTDEGSRPLLGFARTAAKVAAEVTKNAQRVAQAGDLEAKAARATAADKAAAAEKAAAAAKRAADDEIAAVKRAAKDRSVEARQAAVAAKQVATAQTRAAQLAQREATAADRAANQKERSARQAAQAVTKAARDEMQAHRDLEQSIEELARKEKDAGGRISGMFGDRLKTGMAAAGVAGGAALTAGLTRNIELGAGRAQLKAQLGLTEKDARRSGNAAGRLYANAYGESMSDVNDAIASVGTNIEAVSKLSARELDSFAGKTLNLQQVFGADAAELTRTVGQLVRSGMAKDVGEAFNIITVGFQRGANKSDEFLDTLNEYSEPMKSLGVDAQAFTGMLVKGAEDGVYSIDKIGDAYKEFSIRAVDTSTATQDAYKVMGLDANTYRRELLKGGPAAKQATSEIITALKNIGGPIKREEAGVALFGSMFEDLGAKAILGLDPTKVALEDVGGAARKLGDDLSNTDSAKITKFRRGLEQGIEKVLANDVIPALKAGADALSKFADKHPEILKMAGALLGVSVAVKAIRFAGALTGLTSLIQGVAKLQRATRGPGGVMGATATSALPIIAGAPAGRREGRPLGMLGTWQMTRGLGGTRREASAESIRRALGRVPLPPVRGVAGALAAGGVGAAVSGGSVLGGAASGAAIGAIGGPWGMAAGAAAGAGITAIVNQFRKAGTERTEKAGREFAARVTARTTDATEAGLRPVQAARLGEASARVAAAEKIMLLERRARDLDASSPRAVGGRETAGQIQARRLREQAREQARGAGLDYNAVVANRSNALRSARQTVGQQVAGNLRATEKQFKFFDERTLKRDLTAQLAVVPRSMRDTAARSMVEFARTMERDGRLAKGATERLVQELGVTPGRDLPRKFSHAARAAVQAMDSQLEDRRVVRTVRQLMADISKVTNEAKIDFTPKTLPGSVAKLRAQLDVLRKTAKDKSVSAEMRAEAARHLPAAEQAYEQTLSRMAWRLGMTKEEADKWARGTSRAVRRASSSAEQVDILDTAVKRLEGRMGTSKDVARKLEGSFRDIGLSAKEAKARVDELMKTPKPASGSLLDFGDLPDFSLPKPKKPKKGATGGRLTSGGFQRFAAGGIAAMLALGAPAFAAGGVVPAMVSPGEVLRYPGGQWAQVPGERVAADNVAALLPFNTEVYTDHGQSLLASGFSRRDALRDQMPHFAKGGVVRGKVSWFGGPRDGSDNGLTASGISQTVPGVAIRPGKSFESGRPYLRGYWRVTIKGRSAVLQQTDLGPHEKTGRRIDVLSSALAKLGFTEKNFPTDAAGSAQWLGKSKKAAAAARADRTSSSGDTVGYTVNRRYGRSATRAGLLDDAYTVGYSGVETWGSRAAARRAGAALGVVDIRSALDQQKDSYTRKVEVKSKSVNFGKDAAKGVAGKGWLRPVAGGTLTSGYGARSSPGGVGSTNHDGVDIGVPSGTPVRAAKAGRVTVAGVNGGYGNYVRLAHANNVQTFYGHLSKIGVSRGQRVARGAQIALSGNTGTSTGPHLHFGASKGGASINPASLMRFRRGGVARFASGGKATPVAKTLASVRTSASQGNLEAFGAAIESAAVERVERLRQRLLQEVHRGGDRRAIDRVRAALSQIQIDLAGRVQESLGRVGALMASWERKTDESAHWMRRTGVDPSSVRGLDIQRINTQTYLRSQSQSELAAANKAVSGARANLKAATTPEERDAARTKLKEAQDKKSEILDARTEAKTVLEELARQMPQALANERVAKLDLRDAMASIYGVDASRDGAGLVARQQEYSAQLAEAIRTGNLEWQTTAASQLGQINQSLRDLPNQLAAKEDAAFDFESAMAALTDGEADDQQVREKRQQRVDERLQEAIRDRDAAIAVGDQASREAAEARATDQARLLAQIRDEIKAGNTAQAERDARDQALVDLLRQIAENTARQARGAEVQAGVTEKWRQDQLDGQIATNVGRRGAMPGYPGGGVRG